MMEGLTKVQSPIDGVSIFVREADEEDKNHGKRWAGKWPSHFVAARCGNAKYVLMLDDLSTCDEAVAASLPAIRLWLKELEAA